MIFVETFVVGKRLPKACAVGVATLALLGVGVPSFAQQRVSPPSAEEFRAQLEREKAEAAARAPKTDEERVAKARAILEDHLIDYNGSRLRGMHLVDTGKTVAVCGEINAPNRMGGMSGWQYTAIILEGRDYAPFHQVSTNGYSGLSDYREFCPKEAQDAAYDPRWSEFLEP